MILRKYGIEGMGMKSFKKRILWISKRRPTDVQVEELKRIFGEVDIVYHWRIVTPEEVLSLMEIFRCDELIGTFNIAFYRELLDAGVYPIKAVEQKVGTSRYKFKEYIRIYDVQYEDLKPVDREYTRVLWLTRHKITDDEYYELERIFKKMDVIQYYQIIHSARDIKNLMERFNADELVTVIAPQMYRDILRIGIEPIKPLMVYGKFDKYVRIKKFAYYVLKPKSLNTLKMYRGVV